MRIVGGKFKSRVLKEFDFDNIRPTADNVRESLFNILGNEIDGATFLDLFCGTGAVGIEALSRGAKKVVFNDISKDSIKVVKDNLNMLKVDGNDYIISNSDSEFFLKNANCKFDIIYIDPPYKLLLQEKITNLSLNALKDNGIIVVEDEMPISFDTPFLIKTDERKYGRIYLAFFKKAIPKDESCIFAGTFDPITNGHIEIVKECLKRYKTCYVAIGVNPEKEPMFSLKDRLEFIKKSLDDSRVIIDSYTGLTVDYMKKNNISISVRGIRDDKDLKYEKKMAEYNKSLSPNIKTEFIFVNEKYREISSSLVRKKIISNKDLNSLLPNQIIDLVREKANKEDKKI